MWDNNNNNELYFVWPYKFILYCESHFKNQNYIIWQLRYFGNNLSRTSKQAEIYFMNCILIKQWRIKGRGPGAPPPSPFIFRPNWGLKGRKYFFWRPLLPLSKGLGDRLLHPPPLLWRSGSATVKLLETFMSLLITMFTGNWVIERLRFTFTPNGRREFVPRDQVFLLFSVYSLLLLHKNK